MLDLSAAAGRYRDVVLHLWSWLDVLQDRIRWSELSSAETVWLRLESPGKNWEVEQALLRLGANGVPEGPWECWSREEVDRMSFQPGVILAQYQWYRGWQIALGKVAELATQFAPHIRFSSAAEDVGTMFDKHSCQRRLEAHGVDCPAATEIIHGGYAEILELTTDRRWARLFLKTCHASSASGLVAIEFSPRHGVQACSTVEMVATPAGVRLFNSRRLQRYTDPVEVARLCDHVCRHRAYVQRWFPKAGWEGFRMDFRVVVIAGAVRHVVPRLSRLPMTNLQLGGRRGDVVALKSRMGEEAWHRMLAVAGQAASAFPDTLHVSLDIAASSGFRRFTVLEANAFGDFLPGLLWEGRETYDWEMEAMLSQVSPSGA